VNSVAFIYLKNPNSNSFLDIFEKNYGKKINTNDMKDVISSLVRHGLTTAGGTLVAKGAIAASTLDEAVGAVMVLVGVVWSIIQKLSSDKKKEDQE
jgi:hypothetical protein